MYMKDLNMKRFTEVRETIDTVIIPIGMVEAHGPHCSLTTDILIPRELLKRLDSFIGEKVLIAPEISYGHSWENSAFPGTINISVETFSRYVFEVAKEFIQQGFRNIVFFNGHGGNISALKMAAEDLTGLGAVILTINWWSDYRDEIMEITKHPGHAGEDETSLVLAIDEKLADVSLVGHFESTLPRKIVYKGWSKDAFPDVYVGNAGSATAEKGEKLYQKIISLVLQDFEMLWKISAEK
ncbi:MAG: creatininase family protein [Tuberibacillus sp.]